MDLATEAEVSAEGRSSTCCSVCCVVPSRVREKGCREPSTVVRNGSDIVEDVELEEVACAPGELASLGRQGQATT
jgi:hypothetical protein